MNWFDLGSALVFYALVLIFVYRNRSKFKRYYGVMFLYRVKIGLKQMYDFGERNAAALKLLATVGVIISFFFLMLLPKMLFDGAVDILTAKEAAPQIGILIPGIQIPGSALFVPFWYGIISIIILAFVHEFGHAIVAAAEGVKSKNDGFGFFFFIPVFFVELDDKQVMKKEKMQRMRIAAAGPTANLLTALAALLIVNYLFTPMIEPLYTQDGVLLTGVTSGLPGEQAGLAKDQVIVSVNNTVVKNTTVLVGYLEKVTPGHGVNFEMSSGENYYVTTTTDPENTTQAYVGITFTNNVVKSSLGNRFSLLTDLLNVLYKLFVWIGFLNFGVGVMNFLPIWLVDGGQILYNVLLYFIKDEKKVLKISSSVFWFVLLLFLINIFGPFIF